jgi:hypothetical protein
MKNSNKMQSNADRKNNESLKSVKQTSLIMIVWHIDNTSKTLNAERKCRKTETNKNDTD